ncbi:MBL fold metallo-hydrolase [Candidatus Deferrimicrobium sp.]|uniref:MBL fold metallo-hydrolase n=1 Tax=Candidatus Deferrimicrobium sp. TaxID=3060586 RepID=UPI002ED248B8
MTFTLHETRLRENVWVWTPGGDRIETSYGANCTAVVGRDSALVVDPLIAPSFARLVAGALSEKTSLPVEHVVVTHHHRRSSRTPHVATRWRRCGTVSGRRGSPSGSCRTSTRGGSPEKSSCEAAKPRSRKGNGPWEGPFPVVRVG